MTLNKLEDWVNISSIIKTKYGEVEGMVKYGIRLPIRSGTIPLKECEPGSKNKIEGERAKYWFVNDCKALKIRLITHKIHYDKIKGLARDIHFFKYEIRKSPDLI